MVLQMSICRTSAMRRLAIRDIIHTKNGKHKAKVAGRLLSVVHFLDPDGINRRFGGLPFFQFTPTQPKFFYYQFLYQRKVRIFLALVFGKRRSGNKIGNLDSRILLTTLLLKA